MLCESLNREPVSLKRVFRGRGISHIIETSVLPLIMSWHLELILEHLAAVDLGQIKRLLINVPPRSLKSSIVSVTWPTWSWTARPWRKFIFSSYSASLSTSRAVHHFGRRVLESEWFLNNWGDVCRLESDQNQKAEYQNTLAATRISSRHSVGADASSRQGATSLWWGRLDLSNCRPRVPKSKGESSIEFFQKTLLTHSTIKNWASLWRLNSERITWICQEPLFGRGGTFT